MNLQKNLRRLPKCWASCKKPVFSEKIFVLISTMNLELASDYASIFHNLRIVNLISTDAVEKMADMARFRNLLVHHWRIDHEKIYDSMEERIETLEKFTEEISNILES